MPRAAGPTKDDHCAGDVSAAAATLPRRRRERRCSLGNLLESGERYSNDGNAGVQGALDGNTDLASNRAAGELRQDTGFSEGGVDQHSGRAGERSG